MAADPSKTSDEDLTTTHDHDHDHDHDQLWKEAAGRCYRIIRRASFGSLLLVSKKDHRSSMNSLSRWRNESKYARKEVVRDGIFADRKHQWRVMIHPFVQVGAPRGRR